MDSPAPAGAAMFPGEAANKTAALSSDKRPDLQLLSDSKQQPGQLSSPASVLSPRCSACSSATASAVGSSCTSARSSLKGPLAAGHCKPPWNVGTKAVSVSKVYADAASSPTSSPHGTTIPSSPRLWAASCTSTAVAPSGSTPSSLHNGAITSERAAKAESCPPSDDQTAKVNVLGVASFGPEIGSVPPAKQVITPPPRSPVHLPDRLITSSTAAGTSAGQGAAAALPGRTLTAAATSAGPVATPRAVAGLNRKPNAVTTITNGQNGAENQLSAPGTAASSSTASRPAKPISNGNHSTASSKATSSQELGSTHSNPSASSQSARSLESSSSPNSPKQLQQQLASGSKGSSLKSIQASQATTGAASAPAVQKPRRSAVEAMLQKQFSTEVDFEMKVQQWRGKEAGAGATQAIVTADSAGSEAPAHSLAGLTHKAAETLVDLSSRLSATQVVEPIAAMASAVAGEVQAENPSNMVPHTAADRSVAGVTPFAVIGLETAGSSDADACCYFSTPRRGERDLFKRQRASIVGEADYTVKPPGVGVAAKQQEVSGAAEIAGYQPVQHQELKLLLPAPAYQGRLDKSSADGNCSSSMCQPGQQLQGLQQLTDSNQQPLLQEQDSVAEVEELQQPMQQRMPSLPLQQQYAGLQSPLHSNTVQQVQQQQQSQQQVHDALPYEPLLDPVQQRWPSLPVLQEEQRRSSLLLRLPGSAAGGIDLGMAGIHGAEIEPPTPQFAVLQRDQSGKDTMSMGAYCLKGSNVGWQPSSINGDSNHTSAVICSLSGEKPESSEAPAAGDPGTTAALQQEVLQQLQQQQQRRSLQYSTSGCVRISTDTDGFTSSNVSASDDFTAAVRSFSGRYPPGLFVTSGPCAAATLLPGSMAPAADPAVPTIVKQQHGCTAVAATNNGSSGEASYDCTNTIRTSSPTVEAAVYRPSRRVSRHSRQVSMDGSTLSGSEAASLAAIAAELEDIRRSSHDSRMVGARPAAAAIIDAADTGAEVAADASSAAAGATSASVEAATSEAAMAVLVVELSQAGRQSMRVSHHSRQVSMDGCSNVSWPTQLYSELPQRVVSGTPVGGHCPARAADVISRNTPEQPPESASAHQGTTANTHAAVPGGSSTSTQATTTPVATRQVLGLPAPNSVQDVLQLLQQQQGHSLEIAASSDKLISPDSNSIASCADTTVNLSSVCSSASGLTQSNRSAVYQNSVEGDSAKQDMEVIWNQMYDLSLADRYRDSDAAVTRTNSAAAELAADSPAVATASIAGAVGSAEEVSEAAASLVTTPVDSLYLEDSLPPLEAANSLVCMGSSVYSQDPANLGQEAVAPAVKSSHSTLAAERDADADAAEAASDSGGSQAAEPGGAIALLFEMKQLLQEDIAALRASIDSLGQPSPGVQQQQQQQQKQQLQLVTEDHQQNPVSVAAASVAAATATAEGDDGLVVESQLPSLAQAALPRMQVPHSPSAAGTGSPSISVHALPMSHMPYAAQTLSSRILQQLYPASPSNSCASSGRSSPALAMGNASITAVGSGRIPNQWGFAAAKLMNALTSTTNPGSSTAGSNIPTSIGSVAQAPQAPAAPVAAPPPNSTPVLTGVHHIVHRTMTSRVRSLLGDAAAAADAGGSVAPGPGGLRAISAHQPGDGVAAMHVDASGLLQVVLQVQLPAGILLLASSAGQ